MTDPRDEELDRLRAELVELKAENARLRGESPSREATAQPSGTDSTVLRSTRDKLALFRSRFVGRTDVYPLRWQNATGRSGYAPACHNEWVAGLCGKPAVKCSTCPNSAFKPVTDALILEHFQGKVVAGVYPMLPDDTCRFLAVDFDDADWRGDALAYARTARAAGVPVALEISRSGEGAHAWTFFGTPVTASEARRLGSALLTATCREQRQLQLSSYDRLFPSQDTVPAGGFGNLIALPFQAERRGRGCTVFVDDEWRPIDDQWAYLESLEPIAPVDVSAVLTALRADGPDVDALLLTDEETATPWVRLKADRRITGPAPDRLVVTRAQQIYVAKDGLSPRWIHRLVRLATFQNPAFYQAQAMRRSVWNTPRLIGCAENHPQHVALPRGLYEALETLAAEHGVPIEIRDVRSTGTPLEVRFAGELTSPQQAALDALAAHDTGLLWGATGFGKTVVATALIARRGVSTLILVHRAELLAQWRARLSAFLERPIDQIGALGSGEDHLTGILDVALLQSLARRLDETDLASYCQIIVDECHHVPAVSFETILKAIPARYVLGLTATPIRRDGQHPIMHMQIGPVRYSSRRGVDAVEVPEVRLAPLEHDTTIAPDTPIQTVLATVARSAMRNDRIIRDVLGLFGAGRRVLLLTERTDHVATLEARLQEVGPALFRLHGRMTVLARKATLASFREWSATEPFILLATGRLIGEGFDDPRFDALVLALPFSWKGTLQQYVGRLYRPSPDKPRAIILDYVDTGVPVLERMATKRRAGYAALGAAVLETTAQGDLLLPTIS
ncbi:MAG TPA: DEAD/DEAH box helicase family protein [Caldimonas sp.]|nr:DEAD/DEAH box helicase family protein [Caldimonas sp.]